MLVIRVIQVYVLGMVVITVIEVAKPGNAGIHGNAGDQGNNNYPGKDGIAVN